MKISQIWNWGCRPRQNPCIPHIFGCRPRQILKKEHDLFSKLKQIFYEFYNIKYDFSIFKCLKTVFEYFFEKLFL